MQRDGPGPLLQWKVQLSVPAVPEYSPIGMLQMQVIYTKPVDEWHT